MIGYVWDGDYKKPDETKSYSKFWTKILLEKVKPSFENGAFWMPFDHIVEFYKAANICLTQPWNENRIKGE